MNLCDVLNCKFLCLFLSGFLWVFSIGHLQGQSSCSTAGVSETLNLPAAPSNLQVEKSYKKTSELFFTLPDSQSIMDYNSYDIMHMEPVKRIERIVYAKDGSGQDVVLKHVLDPHVQFKPTVEPYELMVLYPTSVEIYNRFGTQIYSTELDTVSNGGGDTGGGSQIDSNQISFTSIEGDSIFHIEGPDFITKVNKPKGIVMETVYDEFNQWIEKEITFYDPGNDERTRPFLEVNITRDTLPITGDCVFRVISIAYEEYCSVAIDSASSGLRIVEEVVNESKLTMTKWPNPASGFINVVIESNSENELVEIELIDMEGKVINSAKVLVNQQFLIDVSGIMSGLYLIRATTGSDMIIQRVVIQN